MQCILIRNIIIVAIFATPAIAGGDSEDKALSRVYNKLGQGVIKNLQQINGMKWVKGYVSAVGGKSTYDITSFFVPQENNNNITFIQTRMAYTNSIKTLNLGLGHRHHFENYMAGFNVFYDLRSSEKFGKLFSQNHKRASLGLELKTAQVDTYANIYRRLSQEIGDERVMNGFDAGVSGFVTDEIKLNAQYYNFKGDIQAQEKKGQKLTASLHPNKVFTLGVEHDNKTGAENTSRLFVEMKINLYESLDDQLSSKVYVANQPIWSKRYDEVERTNEVHVENAIRDTEVVLLAGTGSVTFRGETEQLVIKTKTQVRAGSVVTTGIGTSSSLTIEHKGDTTTLKHSTKVEVTSTGLNLISGQLTN